MIFSFVKVALNSFTNIPAKFVECFPLGVDTETHGRSGVPTVDLVFSNFEYYLLHSESIGIT